MCTYQWIFYLDTVTLLLIKLWRRDTKARQRCWTESIRRSWKRKHGKKTLIYGQLLHMYIRMCMYLILSPSPYSHKDNKSLDSYQCFVVRQVFVKPVGNKRIVIGKVSAINGHEMRFNLVGQPFSETQWKPLTPWVRWKIIRRCILWLHGRSVHMLHLCSGSLKVGLKGEIHWQ